MEFIDRVSAYPNRYVMTDENGNTSYIYLERADEPTVPGTPLNAETFAAMSNDIAATFLPLSGGTMTGPLTLSYQNLKGWRSLNGVKMGAFRFDTNTTCDIPLGGNKWGALVCVTSPGGYTALHYLAGQNGKSLDRTHKICGDNGYGIGFAVNTENYLTVTCHTNWSTGWYITISNYDDMKVG